MDQWPAASIDSAGHLACVDSLVLLVPVVIPNAFAVFAYRSFAGQIMH